MLFRVLALSIFVSTSVPGPAANRLVRQPTEQWVVNFADAQCVASRNYGTREKPLILALKAPPLGEVVQLIVLRPGHAAAGATQEKGLLTIGGGEELRTSVLIFPAEKQEGRVHVVNLPLDVFARVRTAPSVGLRVNGYVDEVFQLAQMEPLLKVMDECVADLRKVWNVGDSLPDFSKSDKSKAELSRHPNLRQHATGTLRYLFKSRDYPAVAIGDNDEGVVALALLINEKGRVADCSVIKTSGAAALDAQSCAILKDRARFKPAIGLDGRPAKDAVIQRINWDLR